MSIYKGIAKQSNTTARAQALATYEKLAADHPEYRRVVRDVANAKTQEEEIDTLLSWYDILTHDNINGVIDPNTGELARYDHDTVHTKSYRYSWHAPKEHGLHDTEYAGGLDEEGAPQDIPSAVYGTTFSDLYAEVIQLVAYTHYHIPRMYHNPNVVPISACTHGEVNREEYRQYIEEEEEGLTE